MQIHSAGGGGIGVVCRNAEGTFVTGFSDSIRVDSAFEFELHAFKRAILLTDMWPGVSITIEMDCKELFDIVSTRSLRKCSWLYHGTVSEVFQLLLNRNHLSVSFVHCKGNQAADCLAALASRELGPSGLIVESPTPLAPVIFREAMEEPPLLVQLNLEEDREGIG